MSRSRSRSQSASPIKSSRYTKHTIFFFDDTKDAMLNKSVYNTFYIAPELLIELCRPRSRSRSGSGSPHQVFKTFKLT